MSEAETTAPPPDKIPLARKLAKVMAAVGYIQKGGRNQQQGYSYASAEQVLKRVNELLSEMGVAVSSQAELIECTAVPRGEKPPGRHAIVRISLTWVDAQSGQSISVSGLGEGSDTGDKAVMKANTAAIKYALQSAFLISWGDDPEASKPAEEADEPRQSTSKAKGKTKAKKDEVPLAIQIEAATTAAELDALKKKVKAAYDEDRETGEPLVAAWKAKKAALAPAETTEAA